MDIGKTFLWILEKENKEWPKLKHPKSLCIERVPSHDYHQLSTFLYLFSLAPHFDIFCVILVILRVPHSIVDCKYESKLVLNALFDPIFTSLLLNKFLQRQ